MVMPLYHRTVVRILSALIVSEFNIMTDPSLSQVFEKIRAEWVEWFSQAIEPAGIAIYPVLPHPWIRGSECVAMVGCSATAVLCSVHPVPLLLVPVFSERHSRRVAPSV